ncbi:hypothetical protein SY88_04935 [Clostridiales bacterium PH28_bin88]|nr:hypothetical protein SY88_04935 [Clostridiales bacterium PH28_bin88]
MVNKLPEGTGFALQVWDAHVHMFPERLFEAIWRWFDRDGWRIPYTNWSAKDMDDYLAGMGVERAFLLPYAHKPGMSMELNAWVRDFCQTHHRYIPFAAVHPDDSNLEEVLTTTLDDWSFAGLKLHPRVQGFAADEPRMEPIYRAAGYYQKPVVIHTGRAPYPSDLLGVERFRQVLERHPGVRFVVPHLGLDQMEEFFDLLPLFPHLYLDVAWLLANPKAVLPWSRVAEVMERFPDRFLYGSDFPIMEHDPAAGLVELEKLGLSPSTLAAITRENARRLVGVDEGKV